MKQRSLLAVHALLFAMPTIAAAQVTSVTPGDARLVTVAGLVRDSETGQPLADIEIALTTGRGTTRVHSDRLGRYEAQLAPGLLTCEITDATEGYSSPWHVFGAPIDLARGDSRQTLPPIDLKPARIVRGVVVDENNQPVVGAAVQAFWWEAGTWFGRPSSGPRQAATLADANGEFRLSGIDSIGPIGPPARPFPLGPWLMASIDGAATVGPELIPPDANEPVQLRVEPGGAVSIAGRAVDAAGRPVPNAYIEIWVLGGVGARKFFKDKLAHGGSDALKTNDDGRFQTARRFSRGAEYAFRVRADGWMPAESPYVSAGDQASLTLPDVALARLRAIEGRVIDRQMRPIAGARIFQSGDGPARSEALSDADGHFVVESVVDGPAFLFAEKSGYRFHGQLVGRGMQHVELLICRASEPAEPLSPQPPEMPREEELDLARRSFRPLLDEGFAERDALERSMILRDWAKLNPGAALEMVDRGALSDAAENLLDSVRFEISRGLVYSSADDAAAVAESINGTDGRTLALILLAGKLPESQRNRKLELLERAVALGRASDKPEQRALWLECVADGLLDLGEFRSAAALLDDARALAASLPKEGPGSLFRAYVAEVVARVDLNAALDLSAGMTEEFAIGNVHGNIAYRIADRLPTDAEGVLELWPDSDRRDAFIPRVCYRMASADPRRARVLAEKIRSPLHRAHALGMMAMALAATDAAQARDLLAEAFDVLRRISDEGEERIAHGSMSAAFEAALLARAAESIDAAPAAEYFWRALSLRTPTVRDITALTDHKALTLAVALAQSNRTIARIVLEPVVERYLTGNVQRIVPGPAFAAACAIDPRWGAEIVQRLSAQSATGPNSAREKAIQGLAQALGAPPEHRMRAVLGEWFARDVFWPGAADNYFLRLRN